MHLALSSNPQGKSLAGFILTKSPNTQALYLRAIKHWDNCIKEIALTTPPTVTEVHLFYAWLKNQQGMNPKGRGKGKEVSTYTKGQRSKFTPSTIKSYLAALQSMESHLLDAGFKQRNIFKEAKIKINASKGRKFPTPIVEFSKVRKKIEAQPLKEQVILWFLFACGMRVSEVVALNVSDIVYTSHPYIRIVGPKAGGDRNHVLPEIMLEPLERYVSEVLEREQEILFLSDKTGERISRWGINRITKKVFGVSSHVGRATVISKLFSEGVDPVRIMKVSGHSTMKQVMEYNKLCYEGKDHPSKHVHYD